MPNAKIAAIKRDERQVDVFIIAKGCIKKFEELPTILNQAQALGTNIIYLWDYWQQAFRYSMPHYWNKGDYQARADLGGERALKEGIRLVHSQGGKIIFYIEPFIAYVASAIATENENGEKWQAYNAKGATKNQDPYRDEYYKFLSYHQQWTDHIVKVAKRIIGEYNYPEDHVRLSR